MNINEKATSIPSSIAPESQKKFVSTIKFATENDWESYKKLRLLAITGESADMFRITPEEVEKEKARTEKEWKEDFTRPDIFIVLSFNGAEPIGMGRVSKDPDGVWVLGAGYTLPEIQGKGIGMKLFATRLQEIQRRGGTKARVRMKSKNERTISMAEKFGFVKDPNFDGADGRQQMELDLTSPKDFFIIFKK